MYFNPLRDHCVVVETINKPFGNEEFYHLYRRFLAVHFVIVVIASESSTVGSLLKVQLSSVIKCYLVTKSSLSSLHMSALKESC